MVEFSYTNDFDRFINISVYIFGVQFLQEDDMKMDIQLHVEDLKNNKNKTFEVFREKIELNVKKYIVEKIKKNTSNIIEISKKFNVPIFSIVQCIFINNKIDHLQIEWSSSALKEFFYVPNHHYLTYFEDNLTLKVNKIKFHYT
jgi:hypothetical protein